MTRGSYDGMKSLRPDCIHLMTTISIIAEDPFANPFFFILLLLFLIDGVFLSCGDFVSLNDVEMMNMHWALSKLFISCLIDA